MTVEMSTLTINDTTFEVVDKQARFVTDNFVTPQMFGAVGDGVTDDTQAFIDAIANSNGMLIIPAGNYLITSTIVIDKQIIIEGAGSESATITYTGDGYLFDISTDSKNRAVLKGIKAYGTTTNSFVNCANGSWGACFTIEECYIVQFDNKVFNLVSAFGTNARNLRIISRGIINAEPYDDSITFGNTITNVHNWENVYYTGNKSGDETEVPITMFHLNNAQYFSFNSCAFEAVNTIFDLANYTQEIVLYGCNIEQTTNLYTKDSTSAVPKFIDTNTAVSRFDANSTLLDLLKTDSERDTTVYIRNGTENPRNDMFDSAEKILLYKVAYAPGQAMEYPSLYKFTTHKAKFDIPINTVRIVQTDVNEISYSLYNIFDYNVGFVLDVDAIMVYADGSRRWVSASVFAQHITRAYMGRTEIKMVTSDDTLADKDTGVFSLDGVNLVLNSDYTCSSIILVVRFNTTGRPLFN